ncbi:hypothetical protein Poli38472_006742 [Pythium oligandrum]|uniref:Hsp70-Hsp90 organising protein n=1 Tax=Pythium oligandrum TaxID=41045 RepID=A0A8K1FEK2_PYTOL|nr:hypothetical protein Poli38472_006742 [Pythium oligandrum]|eukprot:TMW56732.1 hypothetical protein Poli38472_006742 [Pythium oligandrum]
MSSSMTPTDVTDEAAQQAEVFKADGNRLLAEKDFRGAVQMYTRAIELDPDNAVYYSNRSAAYLAMGDERGNALRDADKCIELRPDWWKGYSRKGAAEHALQRFDAARATYQKGLELDPDNTSLLAASEGAYTAGQEHSKRLREAAKEAERRKKQQEEEDERMAKEAAEAQQASAPAANDEDSLLAAFMSEVQELEENANTVKKDEPAEKKEKPPVDFGTSEGQFVRLLQEHYQWINLNPFRVLMLDIDASDEDIKQHYRKISSLVHPDKFRHERAREAFEEVNKAYELLQKEDRRKTIIRTIENAREKVEKERRIKVKKGMKESELGDLEEAMEKAVIKAFAEIEHRRQNLEKREAAQRRREAEQQEKEQEKLVESFKRERTWAEEDRREHRVGNWRSFQKDGKRRKEATDGTGQSWKEEKRQEGAKFGDVDNDAYKKNWK